MTRGANHGRARELKPRTNYVETEANFIFCMHLHDGYGVPRGKGDMINTTGKRNFFPTWITHGMTFLEA